MSEQQAAGPVRNKKKPAWALCLEITCVVTVHCVVLILIKHLQDVYDNHTCSSA